MKQTFQRCANTENSDFENQNGCIESAGWWSTDRIPLVLRRAYRSPLVKKSPCNNAGSDWIHGRIIGE